MMIVKMMTMTMILMETETTILKYDDSITIELLLKPVLSICLLFDCLNDSQFKNERSILQC